MMTALTRDDLYSLEDYARVRSDFRQRVMKHKKDRRLPLGEHATLYFEDRLTMQYQIQEMLRAERIFEAEGIDEELQAYNPLIPDGTNLKATFMLEYPEVEQRRVALARLVGIEDRIWMQVEGHDRIWAIADEDMDRETEEKTSSVHFMRFEFSAQMIAALKAGAALSAGSDHPNLPVVVSPIAGGTRDSLVADLG
ncbi:MAG: DUF3501 family protein [Chromatiales bacterium]|jgi:hypothetical protein|nr:DUF3501 family protein [Chromatiales bacterium]